MLGLSVLVCEKTKIPRRYSLLILADALIVVSMIFAILYLTYTPVGANIVHGGAGRYFIPVIILALSAISALMQRFKPAESRCYEVAPRLFLYGTTLSLSLTAFNFVYFVAHSS
ncbi:hypothetical protein AGMMS49965_14490 [Bacteroidia bacterium]|nr:hypothetical protein AGMMS49965_14490 [Bacteroidia bacterium]